MFDRAFFQKMPQAWTSFTDDAGREMRYQFPTYYDSCRGMMAVYTCSWSKARALLPSRRLLPVPGGFGRALVAVAAFEYLNVKGVAPYNEVLYGFPVIQWNSGKLPSSGLAVAELIVDQPENVQRGKHIWGMHKTLGEMRFFDEDGRRVCEVHRNGRRALRLEVGSGGISRRFEECRDLITRKNGSLLRARSCSAGRRVTSRQGAIQLGADPFAAELQALEISATPLRANFISPYDQAVSLPLEAMPA